MQYKVEISHTTGRTIEEKHFLELAEAAKYFEKVVQTTTYRRVLVTLMHCPAPGEEYMLEVDFVEGPALNPLYPPVYSIIVPQPVADRKTDLP